MLKFYAKENQLVKVPGGQPRIGQADMYVGREFDPATKSYPATKEGYEVDGGSDIARRLARLTRLDKSLYPADPDTASFCGVSFIAVEFSNGVFTEKKSKSVKGSDS